MSTRDSFDPRFWGPLTWKVLYINVLSYPNINPTLKTRTHFAMYFNSLQTVLPCEKCQDGFKKFLKDNPVEKSLGSKVDLLKWMSTLYNNKRPDESKIKSISDLRNMLKGDETIEDALQDLEKRHPKLKLA